jgi:DNA-binding beta-propeller fold protein YncE
VAHPQIAVFARLAKGGDAPHRVIFGQATKLSRTMHDIRYNEQRDEIYVTNPFAQAILTFKGDAKGAEPPIRIIQGPKTELGSEDTLEIDAVNNEIYIPQGDGCRVYPIAGDGDVAPLRHAHRAKGVGWSTGGGIAVDPVHNVVATDGTLTGDLAKKYPWDNPYRGGRDTILIFDRKADGEVMPIRIIRGDKAGIYANRQLALYPKGGWIIVSQITDGGISTPPDTFVGVWSIYDNGNVPPKWRIDGKTTNILTKPRGVTYDEKHKEVIVSDMRLNAVLTFALPEMFNTAAKP